MEKRKIVTNKVIIILCILIICLVFSTIFAILNIENSNILKGIFINGIDVSDLSKEEATSLVSSLVETKMDNEIMIKIDNEDETTYSFQNFDISYNITKVINEAFNIGRTGNIFENNFEILDLLINKKNIELPIDISEDKLNNIISNLSSNIENQMIQTSYYIEDNNLVITRGSVGNIIDTKDFKESLYNILNDLKLKENIINLKIVNAYPDEIDIDKIYNEIHTEVKDASYTKQPLKVYTEVIGRSFDKDYANQVLQTQQEEYVIPLELTYPNITVKDLDIDIFQDLISTFETEYDISNIDRVTNLKLAASKIDGIIISPNQEFSYNKIVGARTISAGYKEAKIYANGEVIDGLGGGICQISSTLYNTAIYANLDVTERHQHQFLTSYSDPGRDATVSYGSKDLRFVNTRSYPIKINATVKNGIVTCSIYGIKEDTEYKVDFDVENISVKPAPIKYEENSAIGYGTEIVKQVGSNGIEVNVYKVLKLDNNIVSRTLLSKDNYSTLDKVILRNTESY